jgi:hypothetical protein
MDMVEAEFPNCVVDPIQNGMACGCLTVVIGTMCGMDYVMGGDEGLEESITRVGNAIRTCAHESARQIKGAMS